MGVGYGEWFMGGVVESDVWQWECCMGMVYGSGVLNWCMVIVFWSGVWEWCMGLLYGSGVWE